MKLAVVHNFHGHAVPSGENAVVDAEVDALRRAGVDVKLLAVGNDEMAARPLAKVRGALTVATGRGRSPLDLLDGFAPDVMHVHNLFPYFGTDWVAAAPAPVVSTQHNFRPLCANGYLFRDGEVCTLCPDGKRWSGVRYGCYRSRLATVPLAFAGRRGAAHDPLIAAATRVIVLSERSRLVYEQAGIPPTKLVRDWHFIPDSLAAQAPPAPTAARAPHWLYVGRLTAEKGIDRLLSAWPTGRHLVVVGDGPERPQLEAESAGRSIEFRGALTREQVLDEMRSAFGLVFPSRWYETFGLVHVEALSVGLPTLALPPNVVAEAVEADGTGMVTSWDGLSGALAAATDSFDELRLHCRAVFESRYTQGAFVERRRRFYDDVCSAHSAA